MMFHPQMLYSCLNDRVGAEFSALCPDFRPVIEKPSHLSSYHFGSLATISPHLAYSLPHHSGPTALSLQHLPSYWTYTFTLFPTSHKDKERNLENQPTNKLLLLCVLIEDHTNRIQCIFTFFHIPAFSWNNN